MKKVCVFMDNGSEEVEALTIVDFLRRTGMQCDLVSNTNSLELVGSHKIKIIADKKLSDIENDFSYDALVIPGGIPGAYNLRDNEKLLTFIKAMSERGKKTAAICAGPVVLDAAGILAGKKATSYPKFNEQFKTQVNYQEELVVVDGNVITSRGPATAILLALILVKELLGNEACEKLKEQLLFPLLKNDIENY